MDTIPFQETMVHFHSYERYKILHAGRTYPTCRLSGSTTETGNHTRYDDCRCASLSFPINHPLPSAYYLLKSTSERLLVGLQMTTQDTVSKFTESRPSF
jgi:hypothetical protein